MVDAVDDVESLFTSHLTLHRTGHHHPLEAQLVEIGVEGFRRLDLAAGLEHHLHTSIDPGHSSGILFAGPGELGSLNAETVGAAGDAAVPATVNGIKLQQVGRRRGVARRIIDVDQFDAGPAPEGPEHQATNPSKAVDANPHGCLAINQIMLIQTGRGKQLL